MSKLTEDKLKKLSKWVKDKKYSTDCDACGSKEAREIIPYKLRLGTATDVFGMSGNSLPLIPILCKNCGDVRFISALKCGIEDNDSNK